MRHNEWQSINDILNIFETTLPLTNPGFKFESRGKIKAKGKGEIEMYFVSTKN
jgi:hypothetical protein